jgi:hypothetical protein
MKMPKIKLLIEVDADGKYCGECDKRDFFWCNVFNKFLDKEGKMLQSLRCKACIKSEVK